MKQKTPIDQRPIAGTYVLMENVCGSNGERLRTWNKDIRRIKQFQGETYQVTAEGVGKSPTTFIIRGVPKAREYALKLWEHGYVRS